MAKAPKTECQLEPLSVSSLPRSDNEILRIIMERVMAAYEAGQVDVSAPS